MQKRRLEQRISSPRDPVAPAASIRYQRVLLLGIGGSGKTSVIRHATRHPRADPRIRSQAFATYSVRHELIDAEYSRTSHLEFDDYRGQNPGDLIAAAKGAAFWPNYTALVVVVDLFPPGDEVNGNPILAETWDTARVEQNLEQLNDYAVDLARGLSSKPFCYMCLFIKHVAVLETQLNRASRQSGDRCDQALAEAQQQRDKYKKEADLLRDELARLRKRAQSEREP